MLRKTVAMMVCAVAGAAGCLLATAGGASAAPWVGENAFVGSSCPGSQIQSGKLRDSSGAAHPTAVFRLYYAAANGGTNCLMVWDNKTGKHYMGAVVQETGRQVHAATDFGTYEYFAGAVGVTRMSGKCLDWAARIDDFGRSYAAHGYGVHCG